ncbi:MAG: hypothetical protein R2791_14550 [Saprospiraceae bacterium]
MRQTKLVEALRQMSTRERSGWRQYVHADFFNKHRALRNLCDLLLEHAPQFDHDDLGKKVLYRRIFGAVEKYNELKINNLISDLYGLLLGFLAYLHWKSNPLDEQYHSLMALSERNLDKQAANVHARFHSLLQQRSDRTAAWHRDSLRYWETGEMLHNRQPRRTAGEHLRRQAEALYRAHTLEKLQLGVAMLSRNTLAVLGPEETPQWQFHILETQYDDVLAAELPATEVYVAAQELLRNPSQESFQDLTSGLFRHHQLLQKDELNALYQCALNYCIRRINDGQPEAYADALSLYRTLLDRDLLLQNGRLSQWTYKNIATTGLRSGEFDWTEDFLHTYRDALLPSERDNAFAFNLATFYFEKQDFSNALRTLQNVEFTDITYHVGAKIMQMKAFCLLGEWEALHSLLDATEQFLRRNKSLSAFGKTTNLNFIRIVRQIQQWQERSPAVHRGKKEQERLGLIEKAASLKPLSNKDWVLKILEELR